MANVLILTFCLVSILSRVESCYIPDSLYIIVPQTIETGSRIKTVEVTDCDSKSMRLTSNDTRFTITSNGGTHSIEASTPVTVEAGRPTFSVSVRDSGGPGNAMVVHLVHSRVLKEKVSTGLLKRTKRRWSPPPFNILENDVGPYPKNIDKIVSDSEAKHKVYYTISGPGVNEHPVGVFSLHTETGILVVHKAVDREEFPKFILRTRVFDIKTHEETDLPLDIQIVVDDVNDNAPTFKDQLQFTVPEQSLAGAEVGKVNATDRDQPGSDHVLIKYTLLTGLDLFAINPQTGVITTVTNTLDREVKDKYQVIVQIKDLYGAQNGLFNTGTATITVGDINDNAPTFTKTSYTADVKENVIEKLVLRIPVEDKDLINTPNWNSKFLITKGNENGNFKIQTDPKTNEGLLSVSKPLDYERNKNVKLQIMARNEADLTGTKAQWLSIPVDINVLDEDEGPEFSAPTVRFTVKENTPNGTLIGSYVALDPETKSSSGIKYYKVEDVASWINVDRNNGELKVANTIDRESPFVHNGLYNITMRAVDASSKSGTGTVIIVVEDVNDNVPTIPTSELVLCDKEGELGSVLVVAEDNDQSPFSAPFSFSLPPNHDDKWTVAKVNDTAAMLKHIKELPTGIYSVPLDVTDLQGFGKTQTAVVKICRCRNGACLANQSSASLGPLGLLALLLPLALLLLLAILLALICVTKREKLMIDDGGDGGGILLKSNTESPGEEVDSSLITVPTGAMDTIGKGSVKGSTFNTGWLGNEALLGAQNPHDNGMYRPDITTSDVEKFYRHDQYGTQQLGSHAVGSGTGFDNRYLTQDSTLLHNWQTNGRYLHQKLGYFGTEEDGRYADDLIHSYGFEGTGSAAGSVGCCSDFGDNDNLDFLNTLGPKFKTLGDVCRKT